MKLMIDIPEDVYTRLFDNGIQDNEIAVDDICEMARALRRGTPLSEWLNSFDTNSATKCFEAVNNLKMKTAQEEMHEADERLLNSNWGDMEVRE